MVAETRSRLWSETAVSRGGRRRSALGSGGAEEEVVELLRAEGRLARPACGRGGGWADRALEVLRVALVGLCEGPVGAVPSLRPVEARQGGGAWGVVEVPAQNDGESFVEPLAGLRREPVCFGHREGAVVPVEVYGAGPGGPVGQEVQGAGHRDRLAFASYRQVEIGRLRDRSAYEHRVPVGVALADGRVPGREGGGVEPGVAERAQPVEEGKVLVFAHLLEEELVGTPASGIGLGDHGGDPACRVVRGRLHMLPQML